MAAAGVLGCQNGNEVTCPALLAACPATLPSMGAPCTARGLAAVCEYGDDPWYGCNTVAYCDSQGGWHTVISSEPDCPTTMPSGCPASFAEAMSGGQSTCALAPDGELTCRYPEGACGCTAAGFTCSAPASAGCPATRPHAGTACAAPCMTWGSGICDGQSMKCLCGTWQPIQCTE
ncbi:MAG TPA: hypothetical protein VH853_20805 [Polyangia bacterium]|nr:hypothetical protein [Polyangia bacterium]